MEPRGAGGIFFDQLQLLHGRADSTGRVVGRTTSGTFSPSLKQGIALCLLDRGAKEGDEVVVDVRGREVAATVTKPPFVQGGAAS